MRELNNTFYSRYDPSLLFKRAITLYLITKERDKFTEVLPSFEFYESLKPFIDDQYFAALRAELHFLEAHQFEALFALMLAWFQDKPHWVYLTEYRTEEIKAAIEQFIAGDIARLTNGHVTSDTEFVAEAVYLGQIPTGTSPEWETNLENHAWLLRRMAERYRDAAEYNAYKHGLRVITGPAMWSLGDPEGDPAIPLLLHQSEDSITYLDVSDIGEGGLTLREITKQFNPEESFLYLQLMHSILDTMTRLRRASLGDTPQYINGHTFQDIDRDAILLLGVNNASLTMTI